MAKIHFIYFDLNTGYYPSFHHGLAYIIATLKKENHNVSLTHLVSENAFEQVAEYLEKEKLDLLGFSFMTNQKKYVRSFLRKIRKPEVLKIAGGAHCTLVKEKVFDELPELNGICIGEGEIPLKELCRRLDDKKDYLTTPSFYFKTDSKIVENPVALLVDIETLAPPDYTLFNYSKIIEASGQCFPVLLSRGCPYSCYYCCNHALRQVYPNQDKYVRFPSIEHSIKIIKNCLSLYPQTKKIIFADDTFTLDENWLSDFCKIYKREIDMPFICNARVETINEQVVESLKQAECISIDFGVESGNEWLRNNILNRRHSNHRIKEAFNMVRLQGIKRFSFSIVGFPFETKDMMQDTLNLNLELQPNFGKCFYFYPYPGTRLYQLCLDFGLLRGDIENVSGYLEAPSLKEIYITHNEIKKYFEQLQVFFYAQLIFSKIKIPLLLKMFLLKIAFFFRGIILFFLNSTKNKGIITKLRGIMRKLAIRYLR